MKSLVVGSPLCLLAPIGLSYAFLFGMGAFAQEDSAAEPAVDASDNEPDLAAPEHQPSAGASSGPAAPAVEEAAPPPDSAAPPPPKGPADAALPPPILQKSPHPVFATVVGETPFALEVRAQGRVRAELVGARDLSGATPTLPVIHRVRVGGTFAAGEHLRIVAEVQDVRTWGEELPLAGMPADPTLFGYSAAGFDLHQGYIGFSMGAFDLRVGRQELSYDSQRLIGAVDWTMQGRSFDGLRLAYVSGAHDLSSFVAVVRNADTAPVDAPFAHAGIGGVHYAWKLGEALTFAPLVLVDYLGVIDRARITTGARANGNAFGFVYDVEGYYQGAWAGNVYTNAALIAGRVGYVVDFVVKAKAELFADVVSGDTDTTSTAGLSPFDTLYATNHKFYGYQDLFLNIPLHSGGRGLTDAGLTFQVDGASFFARVDVHVMAAADLADNPLYGVEPDFTAGYKLFKGVALQGGTSLFLPIGDGLGRGSSPTPWMFVQVLSEI